MRLHLTPLLVGNTVRISASFGERLVNEDMSGSDIARHLCQFVVSQQDMNLSGMVHEKLGNPGKHPVAQVHSVDQHLPVNDLVQDDVVVIGFPQASEPDDLLEVRGVVVQVAGDEESAAVGKIDGRAGAARRRTKRLGRAVEEVTHRNRIVEPNGDWHGVRIARRGGSNRTGVDLEVTGTVPTRQAAPGSR